MDHLQYEEYPNIIKPKKGEQPLLDFELVIIPYKLKREYLKSKLEKSGSFAQMQCFAVENEIHFHLIIRSEYMRYKTNVKRVSEKSIKNIFLVNKMR